MRPLGDAKNFCFDKKFDFVITSPPFPNYRDYYKMFAPENYFLSEIIGLKQTNSVIGSNIVKNRKSGHITSLKAISFLEKLSMYVGSVKSMKDIKSYYIPYFKNYFSDIEDVLKNLIKNTTNKCTCYFVVVNNTTRNFIVPVSDVIMEIFKNNGFNTKIIFTNETFHIGTKNPNSRGLKAKHTKYIIKIWKK